MQCSLISRAGALGLLLACAPKSPGESDSASDGDVSQTDASTKDEPGSSSSDVTGEPTSTTGEPTPTTGESAATTHEDPPPACREGQVSLTPMWSHLLTPSLPDAQVQLVNKIVRLGDGRLAIAANVTADQSLNVAPAVLWVAPDGTPGELAVGQFVERLNLETRDIGVDAGGSVVLVGDEMLDDLHHAGWISRFAPGGPELSRVNIAPAELDQPQALALPDAAVVLGHRREDHAPQLAKLDVATGIPLWEIALPFTSIISEPRLALGPEQEIVVARGAWSQVSESELRVWRVDPQGKIVWERELSTEGGGHGKLGALTVTPGGQIVLLAVWEGINPRVHAISLDLLDGATQWELDVATEDDDGDPIAFGALVDPASLAIPIARGPNVESGGEADPMTAALHVVSLDGTLESVTPLTLTGLPAGNARLAPLRGLCGELILLHANHPRQWLGAFAP